MRRRAIRVLWGFNRLIVRLLFDVRATGLEHMPAPPFQLVANHHNGFDPMLVMSITPVDPRITWFGPREADFSRGFKNRVMAYFGGMIPYNPEKTTLTSAVRAVRRVFEADGVLGIFAEGRIGFRESEMPFEEGAAAFAAMSAVPVVPCAIVGSTDLWFRRRVEVRFGYRDGRRPRARGPSRTRGPNPRGDPGAASRHRAPPSAAAAAGIPHEPAERPGGRRPTVQRRAVASALDAPFIWTLFVVFAVGGFVMIAAYWLDVQDRPDLDARGRIAWSAAVIAFPISIPVYAFAGGPNWPLAPHRGAWCRGSRCSCSAHSSSASSASR